MNEKIINLCKKNISLETDLLPLLAKKNLIGYNIVDKWHPMDNEEDFHYKKFFEK